MPLDNFLADGQPDACAWIFGLCMQPLEDDEDTIGVVLRDANAIIAN